MAFRLNDKHKEIPKGGTKRGKRTIAKERLYKTILAEIHHIKPHFNIGISTGRPKGPVETWNAPYLHWRFVPADFEYQEDFSKGRKQTGPAEPT